MSQVKYLFLSLLITFSLFSQTERPRWDSYGGWSRTARLARVPTMGGALKLLVDPGRQILGGDAYALNTEVLGPNIVPNGNMNNFTGGVDANVLGQWKFDSKYHAAETGDSIHKDLSGNGNHLTRNGWSSYSDMLDSLTGSNPAYQGGNALSFDGVNDYFSIPSASAGALTPGINSISLTGWFQFTDPIANRGNIISAYAPNSASGYRVYLNTNARLYFTATINGRTTNVETNSLSGDTDHHFTFVLDRTAGTVTGYIDGVSNVLSSFYTLISSDSIPLSTDFFIGKRQQINEPYGDKIAELTYYNKALSAQEVKDLYGLANGYTSTGSITPTNNNFAQRFTNSLVDSAITKTVTTTANTLYKMEFDGYRVSGSGNLTVDLSGAHTETFTYSDAVSNHQSEYFLATTTSLTVKFYGTVAGDVYEVDNLKIREVTNASWSDAQLVEDWSLGGKVVSEVILDTGFDTPGNWVLIGTATVSGSKASLTGNATTGNNVFQSNITFATDALIEVKYEVLSNSLTGTADDKLYSVGVTYQNSGTNFLDTDLTVGNHTLLGQVITPVGYFSLRTRAGATGGTIEFGSLSVKVLSNGNHGLAKGGLEDGQPAHPSVLDFDGVNDYVDFGVKNVVIGANDFIIFNWFKTEGTVNQQLFSNRVETVSWFRCLLDVTGKLRIEMAEDYPNDLGNLTTPESFNDNTFHLVAYARKSGSFVKIYVDNSGKVSDITALSTRNVGLSTDQLLLGTWGTQYFDGNIGLSGIYIFDGQDGAPSSLPSDFEDSIIQVLFDNTKPSDFEGGYILFIVWIPIRRRKQYMRAA